MDEGRVPWTFIIIGTITVAVFIWAGVHQDAVPEAAAEVESTGVIDMPDK